MILRIKHVDLKVNLSPYFGRVSYNSSTKVQPTRSSETVVRYCSCSHCMAAAAAAAAEINQIKNQITHHTPSEEEHVPGVLFQCSSCCFLLQVQPASHWTCPKLPQILPYSFLDLPPRPIPFIRLPPR
jgi:hypothetical protein